MGSFARARTTEARDANLNARRTGPQLQPTSAELVLAEPELATLLIRVREIYAVRWAELPTRVQRV